MKLGIFGGTFDPVHLGHLILAEVVREACALDELWFIPARLPPHKQEARIAPSKARIEMLEFAIAGHPQFRVSDLEIRRDGPSYTVETLRHLHGERPEAELFLIIGADSLAELATWHEPEEILRLAKVVAVNRGEASADLSAAFDQLGRQYESRIRTVCMPPIGISATELRARQAAGKSLRYQVPRAVELYLQQQGLYRE